MTLEGLRFEIELLYTRLPRRRYQRGRVPLVRFLSVGTGGCIVWTGSVRPDGYGDLRCPMTQRTIKAPRFMWELIHGPVPAGLHVLHHCDAKLCVNPGHLHLGTHDDNMAEAAQRGQILSGEKQPQSKLSASDVIKLRRLRAGGWSTRRLALLFSISQAQAWRIGAGLSWSI